MTFRVAAVQLAVGNDLAENISKSLRFLEQATHAGAQLVVFPEFCLPSAYRSGAQAHLRGSPFPRRHRRPFP